MFGSEMEPLGQTWIEISGEACGARADEQGPIGGGEGYTNVVSPTADAVSSLNDLLEALAHAKPGDVVYVDGGAEIDCTERVYIESLVLEIPEGVTLASNRGADGSDGRDDPERHVRHKTPDPGDGAECADYGIADKRPQSQAVPGAPQPFVPRGRGHEYYYQFPTSDGIDRIHEGLEVDNCELAGWSHAAVYLQAGDGHHIHHNFIHHNQYNGLGYGVSHDEAFSLIEYNRFDYNRHSLAGTGRAGSGYEARHNVEIGESLSHCFDMHGGRDRKDGTDVAGTWMKVHHNTFRCPKTAVVVRGVPEEGVDIHHNWLYQQPDELSVRSDGKTRIRNNAYGPSDPVLVANADAGQ